MSTIRIESLGKDIELKPYTRAIARAVQEELLKDVIVKNGDTGINTDIPALNAGRSEETAIRLIAGLTKEEIDNMTNDDYEMLKAEVNTVTQGKKK